METRTNTSLALFLGLLSIAISLPLAVGKFTAASRSVTVRGLCEKQVKADRAIWPIVFKEGGNDLVSLAKSVEAKNKLVVDWLLASGISSEEIAISSPRIEDTRTYGYDRRTFDFVVTSIITVCTDKVDEVLSLQTRQFDLLGKGIATGSGSSWEYPVTYEYTALNTIKPEMIEQATISAREAASKFAKDSGSKVGKILTASQGQFTINNRDANTPHIKTVRVVSTIQYQLK